MVQAIGSMAVAAPANSGAAAASLDAQLARYQKLLSECINCDSSKTAQGKAQIEALSNSISAVRARIDHVAAIKSGSHANPIARGLSTAAPANSGIATAVKQDQAVGHTVAVTTPANSMIGSLVDILV